MTQNSRIGTISLPNALTLGRIVAVPAVALCFYFPSYTARCIAVAIFIIAAVTDFFDGYLARIWKQQSELGRMLDPIADKLLVSVCLLVLTWDNTIGGWSLVPALIILCREILVSGLREFLAELQVSVPVTKLAKWKTTAQLVAIGFLLAGQPGTGILMIEMLLVAGLVLLWISAMLTLYTGYDYFRAGIRHVIEEPNNGG